MNSPTRSTTAHTDSQTLPAGFNRLAWSNLAAQSAEQVALAAAPIVAELLPDRRGAGDLGDRHRRRGEAVRATSLLLS